MLSHVQFFVTPWTVAHQTPLSMEFSRQEYWSGLPDPSPDDLPNPGPEPECLAFASDFFTTEPPGKTNLKTTTTARVTEAPFPETSLRILLGKRGGRESMPSLKEHPLKMHNCFGITKVCLSSCLDMEMICSVVHAPASPTVNQT